MTNDDAIVGTVHRYFILTDTSAQARNFFTIVLFSASSREMRLFDFRLGQILQIFDSVLAFIVPK